MADPIVLTISAGQAAVFRSLNQQEQAAQKALVEVPAARNAAAMAVVLATYTPEQIQGQQLQIDTDAGTITFSVNELHQVE